MGTTRGPNSLCFKILPKILIMPLVVEYSRSESVNKNFACSLISGVEILIFSIFRVGINPPNFFFAPLNTESQGNFPQVYKI